MYRKIIVPVDMGQVEKGDKMLAKALTLLDEGGEVILLSVAEDVPGYLAVDLPADLIAMAARQAHEKLAEINRRAGSPAVTEVRIGAAAREILAAAQHHLADLIIIASHRPDFSNYLLGSTAERVVRHANCSVLVDR